MYLRVSNENKNAFDDFLYNMQKMESILSETIKKC